eukprot:1494534-Prymnesium_polylepis.1
MTKLSIDIAATERAVIVRAIVVIGQSSDELSETKTKSHYLPNINSDPPSRSLDRGRPVAGRAGRASARLGALRAAAIDAADEAALGRIRAHRLDEVDLHHLLPRTAQASTRRRRAT